jgi:hypothetical protein
VATVTGTHTTATATATATAIIRDLYLIKQQEKMSTTTSSSTATPYIGRLNLEKERFIVCSLTVQYTMYLLHFILSCHIINKQTNKQKRRILTKQNK